MSLSKEGAFQAVTAILNETPSEYDLVPFAQFKTRTKLRSTRYETFEVLCQKNTHRSAGWLVCRYVRSRGCKLSSGLMKFDTANGGTGRLEKHFKNHLSPQQDCRNFPRQLPAMSKANIARGAAMAVAMDLRPLSFTDKKRGMGMFVNAVFKAGQEMPVNENVQFESILPSVTCVTKALKKIAVEIREEYRELILQKMYETGGGMTTDGVVRLRVRGRNL